MIRTLLLSGAAWLAFAAPAFAEPETPEPQDPRIAEILANLPTEAEIDAIMRDVPDMTRLMTGMMDIVTDEDNHATLERVAARLRFSKSRRGKGEPSSPILLKKRRKR